MDSRTYLFQERADLHCLGPVRVEKGILRQAPGVSGMFSLLFESLPLKAAVEMRCEVR